MCARSAVLPLARLLGQHQPLAPGALEPVVAAGVEGELPALEVADLLRHRVQEVAVVADQDQRARVAAQMLLEPDRGLEVEMVGGLVEQQEVGLEEQHAGQRHAHPPAAGEARTAAGPAPSSSKPSPFRMRAARAGAASAPISISRLVHLGDADAGRCAVSASASSAARARCRSASTASSGVSVAARRLLAHHADPSAGRQPHRRPRRAAARPRSGAAGSTCRCRCGRPGPGACRPGTCRRRAFEQRAAGDAQGDVVEVEHGGRLIAWAAAMPNPGVRPGRPPAPGSSCRPARPAGPAGRRPHGHDAPGGPRSARPARGCARQTGAAP